MASLLDNLMASPDCDLLQRIPPLPPGGKARCPRCGKGVGIHKTASLDRTLALTIAAPIAHIVAKVTPLMTRWRRLVLGLVLLAVTTAGFFPTAVQAQPVKPADRWEFSVTPYLWLPTISGTLNYQAPPGSGGGPQVQVGPIDYLEALRFVLMVTGEARKGGELMFTDIVYLSFAGEKSAVKAINFGGSIVNSSANVSTTSSLRGGLWTLGLGYAIQTGRPVALDVFAGLRYFSIQASTDWQLTLAVAGPGAGQNFPQTGSASDHEELWDGIVGVKGRVGLGSQWSIPYYLDVGTGSSILTWQGMTGLAYSFKWGDVTLNYRYLSYNTNNQKFIDNMQFYGPALGVTFRF